MQEGTAVSCTVTTVGDSPALLAAQRLLKQFARCDASVLIEGETGTGKELAARTVHYRSARRCGPFVPINCGAIPDNLLESELFGHRKGAFTDAKQSSPGVLTLAHRGTVFLDEVDSLSPRAQVALLRFLQDRKFRPLGGDAERSVDVRVIAACNRPLVQLAMSGGFRQDLFYRLNVLSVTLPPLRMRGEDVCLLAEYFLRCLSERYGRPALLLDETARAKLMSYPWPGNVRELENVIEREMLLSEESGELCLSSIMNSNGESADRRRRPPGNMSYRDAKARVVEAFDRRFLSSLLQEAHGNVAAAARVAGKERRDLGRLLRKYNITPEKFRD